MSGDHDLDALVARAQAGDVRAFEALVASHLGQVRRFARAFAAREADADDLAQEALLKAYRGIRLFRYQSAFSTWLYTVVRSVCVDFGRSRAARERSVEDALEPRHERDLPGAVPADRQLEEAEDRQRLWAGLRQISPEFRTVLVLFDIEGHTYDEVAAIEKVPVGTVKSRLSRGREQLRRVLDQARAKPSAAAPGTEEATTSSHVRRTDS